MGYVMQGGEASSSGGKHLEGRRKARETARVGRRKPMEAAGE